MMESLIVIAHPWDGSYNHSLLESVTALLKAKGDRVEILDLNKDGFNPVMTAKDLNLFRRGGYADPLAEEYVYKVKRADHIIFIYPIWWYGEPAILSGFIQKVFLKGHVYTDGDKSIIPLLKGKKATIITTAALSKSELLAFGDPINKRMINGVLRMVGINDVTWFHNSDLGKEQSHERFKEQLTAHFKGERGAQV